MSRVGAAMLLCFAFFQMHISRYLEIRITRNLMLLTFITRKQADSVLPQKGVLEVTQFYLFIFFFFSEWNFSKLNKWDSHNSNLCRINDWEWRQCVISINIPDSSNKKFHDDHSILIFLSLGIYFSQMKIGCTLQGK